MKSKTDAQRRAEAEVEAFREALGPFVTAAEATRMPMMFMRAEAADHPIVFVNQAFLNLTGYEEHELMGQSFFALLEEGTDPEMLSEIRTAFQGGRDLETVVQYEIKDGRRLWLTVNTAPVRNSEGTVTQYFSSFIDVTSQKEEEARLRLLIGDLHRQIDELNKPKNGY